MLSRVSRAGAAIDHRRAGLSSAHWPLSGAFSRWAHVRSRPATRANPRPTGAERPLTHSTQPGPRFSRFEALKYGSSLYLSGKLQATSRTSSTDHKAEFDNRSICCFKQMNSTSNGQSAKNCDTGSLMSVGIVVDAERRRHHHQPRPRAARGRRLTLSPRYHTSCNPPLPPCAVRLSPTSAS